MNILFVPALCFFLLMNTVTHSMDYPEKPNKSDIPQILTTDASQKNKRSKRATSRNESQSSLLKINTETPSLEKKRKPRLLLSLSSGDEKKSHTKPLEKLKDSFSDSSEHTTPHVTPQTTPHATPKTSPRGKSPKHSPRKISPRTTVLSSSESKSPKKSDANLISFDFLHNAIKSKDFYSIKNFLENQNNNVNRQDSSGKNTLLHCALLEVLIHNHDEAMTMLFLMNPRVNSLVKNEYNDTAYQLIEKNKEAATNHKKLHTELRTRALLDNFVHALLITNKNITPGARPDNIMQEVTNALRNISSTIFPCYSSPQFIVRRIDARLKSDALTIQKDCDAYSKDINYQDEWDNTLLHYAAYLHDKTLIEQLIKNPIIFFERNKENLYPQALLYSAIESQGEITTESATLLKQLKKNIRDIRALLFMRDTLNNLIAQRVPILLSQHSIVTNSPFFEKIKKQIIEAIILTEQKQRGENSSDHDRKLPKKNVTLPLYADDKFFLEAFHAQMFYSLYKKISIIKSFLNNPDNHPNIQNSITTNSLLHHAILDVLKHNNNTDIAMLFLKDPRLNSLIKNKNNEAAYQLIKRDLIEKHQELYKELCARAFADRIAHALLMTDATISSNIHPDLITQKVTNILRNIPNTMLSAYSSVNFISEIIKARLKHDGFMIQENRNACLKDINYQDELGNTLLHHAAQLHDKILIEQLIKNPNIVFKHNRENLYPQDLLCTITKPTEKITIEAETVLNQCKKNIEDMHTQLSVRDLIAKKFTDLLLLYPVAKRNLAFDHNFFRMIRQEISLSIAETKHNQKDENRSTINLPTYVDDAFLLEVFYAHVKQHSPISINDLGFNPHPSSTESSEVN